MIKDIIDKKLFDYKDKIRKTLFEFDMVGNQETLAVECNYNVIISM